MTTLGLRPVKATDRAAIFEMMRDPEAVRMAAFTAADPDDREAFDAHLTKIGLSSDISYFVIVLNDRLVRTAATFPSTVTARSPTGSTGLSRAKALQRRPWFFSFEKTNHAH